MSLNRDLDVVQGLVDAALASLEANRGRIDDLNVYPVPDGDTGTNMTMTMRAVKEAVDSTSAASRQSLARDVARGAMMGARGNSGVIFSQIVRGVASAVSGEPLPEPAPVEEHLGLDAIHQELSRYRYCTVFLIEGRNLDRDALEEELDRIGDSLLVVGDSSAIKVHVHTDDPGAALSIGSRAGTIDRIEIANMHEQTQQREERLLAAVPDPPPGAAGVVAVVAGDGNRRLFESLAENVGPLEIVEGGQSMNPSTADLVRAVQSLAADEAIILPNNSNVQLAAELAAANADRTVEVVPTDSIPAGLAAMVAFDGSRTPRENAEEMRKAIATVATGEVTRASRDVQMNGLSIHEGDWLGLADGRPIAGGGNFDDVSYEVVERLLSEPRELLTLLVGQDKAPLEGLLGRIAVSHPDLQVDVQEGGQPHYHLLLSAE